VLLLPAIGLDGDGVVLDAVLRDKRNKSQAQPAEK